MASHSGRSFLNSCLKVPIDPCNNCPAPVYNRPKMYLGRLSMTPTTATLVGCDAEPDVKWSCSSIRPLAKFYDSIPEYNELNHLTEEDFYSTLDTLRSTCRELKSKSANSVGVAADRCSTTSSSVSSQNCPSGSKSKKSKKTKKKKKSSEKQSTHRKRCESQESGSILDFSATTRANVRDQTFCSVEQRNALHKCAAQSLKQSLEEEVECFKKSLKGYEDEFKRPLTSSSQTAYESRLPNRCSPREVSKSQNNDVHKNENDKVPVRPSYTSVLRERLRRSLSFNDIHSIPAPEELAELRKKTKTLERLSSKGGNSYQDPSKLSCYFVEKKPATDGKHEIPRIVVDTPSTEASSATKDGSVHKRAKSNSKNIEDFKIPFKLFDLGSPQRDGSTKHSTPSPAHPVARPNLAATLRVECSRKKVKELKNNCTYHDTTPQVDWEVRKTPAWKTLSLNESHKEILKIRLATRKAEQALQKREYELNMELMKQRVKSAPLLLEGPTYWGPNVGKLTHECQWEGRRHLCQSNQKRGKRKKASSRSQSCRRELFQHTYPDLVHVHHEQPEELTTATNDRQSQLQKINTLRKIYAGNVNSKSQSRCSNHSANSHRTSKSFVVKNKEQAKSTARAEVHLSDNDSGDELSSLDRAFL